MNSHEAQDRLRELQRIMERTTLCTLLPGTPAIIGGLLALAGCAASTAMIRSLDFAAVLSLAAPQRAVFYAMWAAIGIVAVAQDLALSRRAVRRQGIATVGRPGHLAALSLAPNVLVALLLTVNLISNGHMQYVAPMWMVCYGAGVYAAGLFSVRLPRILGLGFILVGAAGLFAFPRYGVLLTALSFGLMHIVFGMLVIRRENRGNASRWAAVAAIFAAAIIASSGVAMYRLHRFGAHVVNLPAYEKIEVGSTKEQVIGLMGEPSEKELRPEPSAPGSVEHWHYGQPGTWEIADIYFDADGRVVRKVFDR